MATAVTLLPRIGEDPLAAVPLLLVLAGVGAEIATARFVRSVGATLIKCAAFVVLGSVDRAFSLLLVSVAFDLAHKAPLTLAVLAVAGAAVMAPPEALVPQTLATLAAAAVGRLVRSSDEMTRSHARTLDNERALRYRREQMQIELDATSRELVRATEHAERTRIAHSLHDDLGHRLSGVLMQLEAARTLSQSDPARAAGMLETAVAALRESTTAVREAVYDLRPPSVPTTTEIQRLCISFRPCPVRLSVSDELSELDESVRSATVGIVRELLTNAARHARAQAIQLRIGVVHSEDTPDHLVLEYHDNGVGATTIHEGMGLTGIRRRVDGFGGSVSYNGNRGFAVDVRIPVTGVMGG